MASSINIPGCDETVSSDLNAASTSMSSELAMNPPMAPPWRKIDGVRYRMVCAAGALRRTAVGGGAVGVPFVHPSMQNSEQAEASVIDASG